MADPKDKLIKLLETQKKIIDAQRDASKRIEEERAVIRTAEAAERLRLAQNGS
jgi:hypothetical protein